MPKSALPSFPEAGPYLSNQKWSLALFPPCPEWGWRGNGGLGKSGKDPDLALLATPEVVLIPPLNGGMVIVDL